jgi:UDP-N-acetylmuramyl pentapeptide synthase
VAANCFALARRPRSAASVLRLTRLNRPISLVTPDAAVVLSVGQAYLAAFGSRAAVARAQRELMRGLAPHGTAGLNADDPRAAAKAPGPR